MNESLSTYSLSTYTCTSQPADFMTIIEDGEGVAKIALWSDSNLKENDVILDVPALIRMRNQVNDIIESAKRCKSCGSITGQ